ncbi:hypothetical protein KL918_003979 [Ogataea parapolymorpha]|uniref:Uncharacterized protein n=1 Tax=Ogataea parapolymorpha (strain ATCC 26012 / BCRC 20466 / JCM 22074 / NRRL Y-7560 / DL-1) TaxID=871575 RepID=W1QB75_OGAPD|nr:hypothetical protein HPODL_03907 [Ogataea parapolymorpha DL-1]ESW98277.1 hypothetical protein HPODL_03907 [Ogataea parapolymorpha DL-1]KAG7865990.1 hypothetical protein KL918_003979 [Ogataea parapolymorpha]KAG7874856.1 hypothetical protein KL916_001100 [Ogataea parapolymorpha]
MGSKVSKPARSFKPGKVVDVKRDIPPQVEQNDNFLKKAMSLGVVEVSEQQFVKDHESVDLLKNRKRQEEGVDVKAQVEGSRRSFVGAGNGLLDSGLLTKMIKEYRHDPKGFRPETYNVSDATWGKLSKVLQSGAVGLPQHAVKLIRPQNSAQEKFVIVGDTDGHVQEVEAAAREFQDSQTLMGDKREERKPKPTGDVTRVL